jgi:hypothetical protein
MGGMTRSEILAKFDEAVAEVVACRNDWRNAGSAERKMEADNRVRAAMDSVRWWHGELFNSPR